MTTLARLQQWYEARKLSFAMTGLMLLLVLVYLAPRIAISIPSGHAGVLWRRFPGPGREAGTDTQTVLGEGITLKWPWDRLYIYDTRLQQHTQTYPLLTKGGLPIQVEISIRYKPLPAWLGHLHKHVGPDYVKVLIDPEVGADAATEVAKVRAEELYSDRRMDVEQAIFKNLVDGLEVRFLPNVSVLSDDARLRRQLLRRLRQGPSSTGVTAQELAPQLEAKPEEVQQGLEALMKDGLVVRQQDPAAPSVAPRYLANHQTSDVEEGALIGRGGTLIYVEDVFIRRVQLPSSISSAIEAKLAMEQRALEYDARLLKEEKEKQRKRIEAEGIRLFQDIVQEGISDKYLKWKAIDATMELAKSPNSKMVFIGSGKDGLPVMLGPLDTSDSPSARGPATAPHAAAPAPKAPAPLPQGETPDAGVSAELRSP